MGVSFAEADGPACTKRFGVRSAYEDAVGDLDRTDDKYGPSIGLFAIRSLRHPYDYAVEDRFRLAWALTNRLFNAIAAYEISHHGADWQKWSVYRNGSHLPYVGRTFRIRTGHPKAGEWNR